jgi:steroid 5-alpha reductase family enzyme
MTTLALTSPGPVLPLSAAAVAVLMLVVWALSVRLPDVSIVDPVWGPAFVLVALVAALAGGVDRARRWLLFALTAL